VRVVFVPLFALCNVFDTKLTVVFSSTAWPLLFMAAFALSNGYLSTLSMIYGPQRIDQSGPDSEIAGAVMILALTFGLFSGSMVAYPVSYVVVGSW
jgi:solute carrier family 29 (equilibrative nucleoside transporter), member 1/2/3